MKKSINHNMLNLELNLMDMAKQMNKQDNNIIFHYILIFA